MGRKMIEWMTAEASALEAIVRTSDSFAEELHTPAHADLWLNNILMTSAGGWYLLDWDDLRIGDPVLDLATLVGPTATDLRPLKLRSEVERELSPDRRARLEILGHATLLDWIIDPLADYIDADVAPAHVTDVRREKERVHRAALALYQERYPPMHG